VFIHVYIACWPPVVLNGKCNTIRQINEIRNFNPSIRFVGVYLLLSSDEAQLKFRAIFSTHVSLFPRYFARSKMRSLYLLTCLLLYHLVRVAEACVVCSPETRNQGMSYPNSTISISVPYLIL
jgi:hypothetical protein